MINHLRLHHMGKCSNGSRKYINFWSFRRSQYKAITWHSNYGKVLCRRNKQVSLPTALQWSLIRSLVTSVFDYLSFTVIVLMRLLKRTFDQYRFLIFKTIKLTWIRISEYNGKAAFKCTRISNMWLNEWREMNMIFVPETRFSHSLKVFHSKTLTSPLISRR